MGKPRIAIYGRHSTDKQNSSSSADQAAACGKVVDYLGGEIAEVYLDPELSGYRRDRPGLMRLLADVRDGRIDVVVSEALDRLARDAEDVAWLGKKLKFAHVRLHTVTEGEIDEIKLAVASMLGSIFLSQLQQKTFRGMEAAVLAGRFAGGRAYGYRKVIKLDDRGELIRGLIEIDEGQAEVVRRILRETAAGLSGIQIAKRLNEEGVLGPRGGQWNASTIRGDVTKAVGIVHNPLYTGRLVWGRREWRKNPDSDRRERRYRLRDAADWIEVGVPDLRIVDDAAWNAAQAAVSSTRRAMAGAPLAKANRRRHLLSGSIRCGSCGSNYVISGKDYYRCASHKERGTCANSVSVRKEPLEDAALSVLANELLTAEHARIFAQEFKREAERLQREIGRNDEEATHRLAAVEREIANLTANMLAGVVGPTLRAALAEREQEKAALDARLSRGAPTVAPSKLPNAAELMVSFQARVGRLREALDRDDTRNEAAAVVRLLIDTVTILPGGAAEDEAEIVASPAVLLAFAADAKKPQRFLSGASSVALPLRGDLELGRYGNSSSIAVVAGTGFEPVTFRL